MSMEKGHAASDCAAPDCSASNAKSTTLNGLDFKAKLQTYRVAKAALDMHCAQPEPHDIEPYEAQTDALSDVHAATIDAILLTPASDQSELMHKLQIMATEDIMKGWYQGPAIMALAACDADRLLRGRT